MFFFFQAEDGIRDTSVTGVQTCALPISGLTLATGSTTGTGVPTDQQIWATGWATRSRQPTTGVPRTSSRLSMSSCTSETFMMCCFGADTKVVVIDTAGAPVAAAVQLWPESNNDFF